MDSSEVVYGIGLVAILMLIGTSNHWGPGIKRVLFAIADRISNGGGDRAEPSPPPTAGTWFGRVLAVLVSFALISAGIWAAIQVMDRFA